MSQTITCPKCGNTFEVTEAFSHHVEEKLRGEFEKRVFAERTAAANKAKQEAEQRASLELKDLRAQIEEKGKRLHEAQQHELDLRKRQRELEEREMNMELEHQRKLVDERERLWSEASNKFAEEHRLKDAEKERKLEEALRQVEDMKRRLEQGSQQSQGEVLEIELEQLLRGAFPTDEVKPVPKGIRGADVVQHVKTKLGNYCGSIIWESKRTKGWSDGWVQKLKDDQREVKATVAVIVSTVLPKDVRLFGWHEGVWVCDFLAAIGLANALRFGMIEVARTRASAVGKAEKMEMVYSYLTGQDFRQRLEAIVESFRGMKEDLDAERRSMEKQWAKREQQLSRMIKNTSGLYGDLQGMIGAALQPISRLELPSGPLFSEEP